MLAGTRGGPAAPGEPCWDLAWRLGPRLEALNSAEGRGRKRGGRAAAVSQSRGMGREVQALTPDSPGRGWEMALGLGLG